MAIKVGVLAVLFQALAVSTTAQQSVKNEFVLNALRIDDLSQHNKNCTSVIDNDVSIVYCEDGKLYIEKTSAFVDPYSVFQSQADLSYDFQGTIRDVNLGTDVISIVNAKGDSFIALRKSDLKRHELKLATADLPANQQNAQIIGGVFSNDFITVFLQSNG